jgi:hypothetical protein
VAAVARAQNLCRLQQSAKFVGRIDGRCLLRRQLGPSCRQRLVANLYRPVNTLLRPCRGQPPDAIEGGEDRFWFWIG